MPAQALNPVGCHLVWFRRALTISEGHVMADGPPSCLYTSDYQTIGARCMLTLNSAWFQEPRGNPGYINCFQFLGLSFKNLANSIDHRTFDDVGWD